VFLKKYLLKGEYVLSDTYRDDSLKVLNYMYTIRFGVLE